MATVCGLILVKKMDYRDTAAEEWSNRYWFTGGIPVDDNAWKALAEEISLEERKCYSAGVQMARAYGYSDNTDAGYAVWMYDYDANEDGPVGTLTGGATDNPMAGDQAGFVWFRTNRRNARGKWIYLRKYFHSGFTDGVDRDKVGTTVLAAYNAFAVKMAGGTLSNGRIIRSQAQDEVITASGPHQWVTTRTLKRRGKRPVPATP